MNGFIFQYKHDEKTVTMKLPGDETWSEMQELFFQFLLGCGYVIAREDFFPNE
jgi:hypothetical protein